MIAARTFGRALGALVVGTLFTGCLREELPVPKRAMGNMRVLTACVGADYMNQIWFELSTGTVVSTNSKMDWDIALESAPDGDRILINGARMMQAHPTGQVDVGQRTDTTGYGAGWRIDAPSGNLDSTAVGMRAAADEVVALQMGYDQRGLSIGIRRLQVVRVDAEGYTIRTASGSGSSVQEYRVPKDPSRRFVHFNLRTGNVVEVAPPDGSYDLLFTQFTTQFYEPYMPYLVTGCVNGYSGARAVKFITNDFEGVSLADTLVHAFSAREDAIGYDWKEYSFELSSYEIFSRQVYIVSTAQGHFYKLRFIDFYDQGVRGCPKFEIVEL